MMHKTHPKANMESVVPRGGLANFPGTTLYPLKTQETKIYGTTYRFQEGDAADGTSFAPFGPCKSTRQFPSSEIQHSTINTGTENASTRPKKRKALPQDYCHRLSVPSPSNKRLSRAKRR